MLYGGTQFTQSSYDKNICTDVTNIEFNEANNCTTITIENFQTFNSMAYYLFRLTLGLDVDSVTTCNLKLELIY